MHTESVPAATKQLKAHCRTRSRYPSAVRLLSPLFHCGLVDMPMTKAGWSS